MTLPITVVVPHQASRDDFFRSQVLPAIGRNQPAQLVVLDGPEDANVKRNEGAAQAREPFLFFCDDDCVLADDCLATMLRVLEENLNATFAYSDFERVVHEGVSCPFTSGVHQSGSWAPERLRAYNFVDTASLMRREAFPGFDTEICKFQDWDLWLTILDRGGSGVYIPRTLFALHYIDAGISRVESHLRWRNLILRKHRIYGKDVWPTISFIVGASGKYDIQQILDSFVPHLLPGDEALILSNGELPWLKGKVSQLAPLLTLHEQPSDPSFEWKHRNIGTRLATSEYLYFLYEDSILLDGALPAMRKAIARQPGKAFVFKVKRGDFILPRDRTLWHGPPVPTAFLLPNDRQKLPIWTHDSKEFEAELFRRFDSHDLQYRDEVIARCLNGQ